MNLSLPRWVALSSFVAVVVIGSSLPVGAENWPQWRGPQYDGTSRETDLPVAWTKASGIAWTCPLPEWSNSTPAIWADAVFSWCPTAVARAWGLCRPPP